MQTLHRWCTDMDIHFMQHRCVLCLYMVWETSVEICIDPEVTKFRQTDQIPHTDQYRPCAATLLTRCRLRGLLNGSKDLFAPADHQHLMKVCRIVCADWGMTSNRLSTDQIQTCQFVPFLRSVQDPQAVGPYHDSGYLMRLSPWYLGIEYALFSNIAARVIVYVALTRGLGVIRSLKPAFG